MYAAPSKTSFTSSESPGPRNLFRDCSIFIVATGKCRSLFIARTKFSRSITPCALKSVYILTCRCDGLSSCATAFACAKVPGTYFRLHAAYWCCLSLVARCSLFRASHASLSASIALVKLYARGPSGHLFTSVDTVVLWGFFSNRIALPIIKNFFNTS